MKVEEGQSVLLYTHHRAHSTLTCTTTEGNISCDEMKLIENIIWNTHSHSVNGFYGDFLDLDSVLRSVLCGKTEKEPAIQVNLWRYRSLDNTQTDCVFFYNGGELSNGDVHKQFLHVVVCLELIGCFCTNGNSPNVTAMKVLSESRIPIPYNQDWLDEHYISMVHPLDTNHRIYFWLCSTHQIKCIRNQLWMSHCKGKQKFCSLEGFPFGWADLWDQVERDNERASRNSLLQKAALLLDGWAKVPFADQTLDDALEYLCCSAGIPILDMSDHIFENDVNCFWPKLQNGIYGPLLGKQSAQLAKVKAAILRREG